MDENKKNKTEVQKNVPIKNAFISVYDKAYLPNLVEGLLNYCPDITIYSGDETTYKAIANLLSSHKIQKHLKDAYSADSNFTSDNIPIDLVVVNLYPFQSVISQKDCALELARTNIDIDGPSALRVGAKNFPHVMTLTEPASYKQFIDSLRINKGATTLRQRIDATKKTFHMLSRYDGAISNYIENLDIGKALECYNII